MKGFWEALISAWLTLGIASAAISPALLTVDQCYPQSATVGKEIEIIVEGSALDGASSVVTPDENFTAEIVSASVTRARVRVTSRPHTPPGLYPFRVISRRGISNAFRLRFTGWDSAYESEPNDRESQATVIHPGTSVNGVLEHVDDSDWYKFHVTAGESLAINLLSGRNGYASPGEPGHFTITLLDFRGTVIRTGFGRFLMDPYFQHRFQREGDYYLIVNHSRMAVTCLENECSNRRLWEPYQLLIGRSPMLWWLHPNVAKRGLSLDARLKADFIDAATKLVFTDPHISGHLSAAEAGEFKVHIEVGAQAKPGLHLMSVPDPSGCLNPLGFVVETEQVQFEKEPNDSRERSLPLNGREIVAGQIDRAGDIDSYFFTPVGTEGLRFELHARSYGSAMTDPYLAIACKEGDLAVSNDDGPSFVNPRNRDPFMEFKAADAANCADRDQGFYLQVRDWSKHFGPGFSYLLRVAKQEPGFVAGLRRDRFALERGKANAVPVEIQRLGGFSGDVRITASDVPPGVTAEPLVIASGKNNGEMKWMAAADANPAPFRLHLSAAAQVDGKQVTSRIRLPQPMLGDGPGYVQNKEGEAWISVVDPVQFSLDRVPPPGAGFGLDRHLLAMRADGRAKVLVRVERQPDAAGGTITFQPEGLPPGVVVEAQRPAEDGKAVEVILKGENRQIAAGEYRITLIGTLVNGSSRSSESLKPFYLRVEH